MSYSVTIVPNSVFTGQSTRISVDGLDVSGGEFYDFGILRDGVTVFGYDPGSSAFIQEITGPVSVKCDLSWLGGDDDDILTVRAYIFNSGGSQIDTAEKVFRLRKGGHVVPYTIDEDVAELPVSGWLPRDKKRNNLYRLMLACGVNIVKGADGNPHFTFFRQADSPPEIADDDLFLAGNVTYDRPYSSVTVLEHSYTVLTDADPVTLYDNTKDEEPAVEKEIWFDQAPVIVSTLTATEGLSVMVATENGAVLTGQGVLTGVPYTHTTRTVSRQNAAGEKEKIVSVRDNTMVTVINSENVLNRLYAFYCPEDFIKKVKGDLVYRGQRTGKVYRFKNVFGEQETAYLTHADLNASSFVRGACEFQANYEPPGQEGLYTHCIILNKATFAEDGGVFQVPDGVTSMKVVLIGGGSAGGYGKHGLSGDEAPTYTYARQDENVSAVWYGAEGGAGGDGGDGGAPGRVKAVTIQNPAASYTYGIGDGGVADEGYDGTASTFDTYSSADQDSYVPVAGVYNPIYGEFYALRGNKGEPGAQGGAHTVGWGGSFAWTTNGADVRMPNGTVYHGGRTGSPLTSVSGLPECKIIAYGGNGAGAAVGVDSSQYPEMNGGSDQETYWEVVEDPEEGEEDGV